MTPEEKAQELLSKFERGGFAEEHALSCVDEILKNFEGLHKPEYCFFDSIGGRKFTFDGEHSDGMTGYDMVEYWNEVKAYIEAL